VILDNTYRFKKKKKKSRPTDPNFEDHAIGNTHIFFLALGLWCSTPLLTIFQLYCGGQFYWWRKPEKTTLSDNVVSSTSRLSGIRTQNVSGDRHRLHL
jgi:hypothetical protein